jgi:uncharacterized integral membrane protein
MADRPDLQPKGRGWGELKDGEPAERSRDMTPRLILAALALLAAVVFMVQNSTHVETSFLFFDFNARLWVVILFSVLLGALLGQAVALLRRRRKKE